MEHKRKFTEHGFGKYVRLHRCLSKADFYISTESTAYAITRQNLQMFLVLA